MNEAPDLRLFLSWSLREARSGCGGRTLRVPGSQALAIGEAGRGVRGPAPRTSCPGDCLPVLGHPHLHPLLHEQVLRKYANISDSLAPPYGETMNCYLQNSTCNFTVSQCNQNQPGTDEHGRKRSLDSIFMFRGRDGTMQEPHCQRSVSTGGHCLSGPPIMKGLKWVTNTSLLDSNYTSFEFYMRSLPSDVLR